MSVKRQDPFVEDLLFELLDACGLPLEEPDDPSAADLMHSG